LRGVDFERELTLASVRRPIREWTRHAGYTWERGYALETRTVAKHPRLGKDYRDLKGIAKQDREVRSEYGIAVRLVKHRERAKRRLRQYRR